MQMKAISRQSIMLSFTAAIVLVVTFMTMAFVYAIWWLEPDERNFLLVTLFIMLGSQIASWILFPSKIAVAAISIVCVIAPGIYIAGHNHSSLFEIFSVPRSAILLTVVFLAVGVTYWRQELGRKP